MASSCLINRGQLYAIEGKTERLVSLISEYPLILTTRPSRVRVNGHIYRAYLFSMPILEIIIELNRVEMLEAISQLPTPPRVGVSSDDFVAFPLCINELYIRSLATRCIYFKNAPRKRLVPLLFRFCSSRDAHRQLFSEASAINDADMMLWVIHYFPNSTGYLHLAVRPGNERFFELYLNRRPIDINNSIWIEDHDRVRIGTLIDQAYARRREARDVSVASGLSNLSAFLIRRRAHITPPTIRYL